ncbi:hepcidin isoform X1 [Trichosurus vulpecula]|uniref:hepcidin isoform X1 n=1 Tax=Trichosurus vulpecula TaxID=9337 RepID=UPI00186B245B|nr:hepcidin isoform X1 [Trichosurus vulpecula]
MALTTQIQITCVFFLLLSNFVCPSVLPSKTRDLVQTPLQEVAPAHDDSMQPLLQRTKRFDSHFSFCVFCCDCCNNKKCGFCCRT